MASTASVEPDVGIADDKECPACRICLCDDFDTNQIRPCRCDGSSRWVHRECLDMWRQANQKALFQCNVCQEMYKQEGGQSSSAWSSRLLGLYSLRGAWVHQTLLTVASVFIWCNMPQFSRFITPERMSLSFVVTREDLIIPESLTSGTRNYTPETSEPSRSPADQAASYMTADSFHTFLTFALQALQFVTTGGGTFIYISPGAQLASTPVPEHVNAHSKGWKYENIESIRSKRGTNPKKIEPKLTDSTITQNTKDGWVKPYVVTSQDKRENKKRRDSLRRDRSKKRSKPPKKEIPVEPKYYEIQESDLYWFLALINGHVVSKPCVVIELIAAAVFFICHILFVVLKFLEYRRLHVPRWVRSNSPYIGFMLWPLLLFSSFNFLRVSQGVLMLIEVLKLHINAERKKLNKLDRENKTKSHVVRDLRDYKF